VNLKKIIIFGFFFLALSVTADCGQLSKIELTDGSVINGEIVSYRDGIYVINTPSFGDIKVQGEKVAKIESINPASALTAIGPNIQTDSPAGAQVSAYGQTLMKNPENAAIMSGLAQDSGLQQIANDPELQDAAKKGDIQALLNNPKFMNIVNSPEVQEAVKKLKK
jgi:hypothetical protein